MPRKISNKGLVRKLDKLVGEWCRTQRSNGLCERCNTREGLQWCHIKTRGYKSVRWNPDNCICMCNSCHVFFHKNPDLFGKFLLERYPKQLERLNDVFKRSQKVNSVWLELQLGQLSMLLSVYKVE